ncbi:MAG: molybdopterin-dependent oxidoreductase [Gammaproteobacteria bacterium]|nr:molybdopterin-dependent oxidoreductase [Gammaproteobacteria bacterium]
MEATAAPEGPPGQATETIFRSCPVCEASCGLVVAVDRAANRVVSVRGDAEDHRSRGYVCAKSQVVKDLHEDPARLRRPVRRTENGWEEMEWEAALALVGERLAAIRAAHGNNAVAMYYGNPNGHNFGAQIYTQLFITLLETQRFFSAGSVDQQPKNLSCELLYGSAWTFPIPDLDRSDFFVCMGANPLVSQGSLMSAPDAGGRFEALRARGGELVVIDPRRSETAAIADWHLFIRPGTDAFLLFALVNLLFASDRVHLGHLAGRIDGLERLRELAAPFTPEAVAGITGVAPADVRRLCERFCAAERPVIYGRIGLCTQEFGTLASWLVDVVNLLRGRLDAVGGAMFPRPATGQGEDSDSVGELLRGRWHSKVRGFPEYMSMLPATLMAEELAWDGEDRARALITVAGNPVLSVPNGDRLREAIDGLDFVVALDIYINETTSRADVILPSTVQLEHSNYDFLFQSTSVRNFARYSPRVLAPEPGARDQWQLMLEICGRVNGLTVEQLDAMIFEGLAARLAAATGVDAARIRELAGTEPGPERLLDMMLRAGPHGDRFAGGEGLTLARVKAAEHGIDLGPLTPGRLPGILRTEGKRIRLLHPLLEEDLGRLRERLRAGPPPGLLLIGRRHIRDMNTWLHNLPHFVRGRNRCTLRMHPGDAAGRGLADGATALVRTAAAERAVPVEISDEMMPGVVSLPHGFGHRHADTGQPHAQAHAGVSANDLIGDGLDLPSGTSIVNGVPVEVRAVPP